MHHWDTVHESAIAPSPIVPTRRPDPPVKSLKRSKSSKRRYSSMPSSVSESTESSLPRGGGAPRPQARSAGMAERPGRNESLSDLVRFFQTQNMPAPNLTKLPLSPDTTTALPAVESKESPTKEVNKELKPLHRRLLQFTQRQKKDPSPRSKADEQQRQIEALQRGGYLLSSSGHKSKGSIDRSKNSLDRSKTSLERTFSRSRKQDVETIGQPWLKNKSDGSKRRLSSLDLDDFGSMVDVAVSLSDFEDSLSPPHPASKSSTPRSRMDQRSASQSTSALTMPSSSEIRSHSTGRPMSPSTSVVDTQGSRTGDECAPRSSTSTNPSIHIVGQNVNSESPTLRDGSISGHMEDSSDQLVKSEPKQSETRTSENHPKTKGTSSHASLKLFPDVAPPRISNKHTWRISSTPRYQTPSNPNSALKSDTDPGASDGAKNATSKEKSSEPPLSSRSKDGKEPVCSGGLVTPTISSKPAAAEMSTSEKAVNGQPKSRPPSLAMGALQAFPLPAPTKPLPSIPKPVRAPPNALTDGKVPSSTRAVRLAPEVSDLQPSQPSPIAEDPSELGIRPSTALGHATEMEAAEDHENLKSLNTTPERPKSTSPEQHTPKWHSVRVPRMQDLPESHHGGDDGHTIEKSLAESPVLGKMTPTKSPGKRAARKGLQINPRANRNNLPFGLPSPPPTATLLSAPPSQPLPERPGHRNHTAPTGAGFPGTRGMDMVFGPGHHRGSVISRSNSSRSSLRHESIPESCEPGRSDSPLPSSDDEGFGPSIVKRRSRRTVEKHKPHTNSTSRGYDTVDGRRSHGRPCYPHPMRSLTPQGRSTRSFDNPVSPQSQYSQSTYGSQESQSSHRAQSGTSLAAHFLEDRVANLERQNQILQAALLAALNAGVKSNLDGLQESAISPTVPPAGLANPYQGRFSSRPESWVSSSRSSEHSSLETSSSYRDNRAASCQLDNMMEDIEGGWLSDKSSLSGAQHVARNR